MSILDSYNAGDIVDFMLDGLEHNELQETNKFLQSCFDCFPESQLCIPEDPIEDLEWFPNFTDDSISLSGFLTTPEDTTISFSGFPTTPERETEENHNRVVGGRHVSIPSKKPRSKRVCGRVWWSSKNKIPVGRKCGHCGVEKTPQWRVGPMGPKTLCNACGVRYKAGRLVPEYRPAASPSFDGQMHSNSHKKIMKMRMSRDV